MSTSVKRLEKQNLSFFSQLNWCNFGLGQREGPWGCRGFRGVIVHGVFGAGSGFHAGWRTTRKV